MGATVMGSGGGRAQHLEPAGKKLLNVGELLPGDGHVLARMDLQPLLFAAELTKEAN